MSYVSSSLFGESYYNDDLFRSIFGYYGWQDDGRPLAEFIYRTLTLNNINIPDMYPLLLIIAICFYCYVCIKVGNVILDRKSLLIDIISCSFIFSPLFASNLWFRYDSFFMVLSLTAAIYPFSINKNITSKVLLGAISLISCLTLYQPSISLFICMSSVEFMFISMRADNNMKSMWLVLSSRVATIALSLFIYFKVVIPLVPAGYYF
ncbi:TPA: glucosyltransferase domain-containing protein, partial [Aeromonas veronii]